MVSLHLHLHFHPHLGDLSEPITAERAAP